MNPEFSPPSRIRNDGRPLSLSLINRLIRRSEMAARVVRLAVRQSHPLAG
jgi:hypothetical protein